MTDSTAPEKETTTPTCFKEWLNGLKEANHKIRWLMFMFHTLMPDAQLPEFSYFGLVSNRIGHERMAGLIWRVSMSPPSGDVVKYIISASKTGFKVEEKSTPNLKKYRRIRNNILDQV